MNSQKYLYDGDAWMLAEEIPDIDFQFSQIWLSSFVNDMEKALGTNYQKILSVYDRGYNLKFYYGEQDSARISQAILKKIIEENFGKEINTQIKKHADKLEEISEKIAPEFLQSLSNEELARFYVELDTVHTEFYAWCWLPNAVDMFHAHFTEYLKSVLTARSLSPEEVNTALVALSFSEEKSFIQDEHESLLRLAIFKKNNPGSQETFEGMLTEHYRRFFYLKHLWIGKDGVSSLDEYREMVDALVSSGDPERLFAKEEETWKTSQALRDACEEKLTLSEQEQSLFRVYAEFAFTKAYRRRIQLYWAYKMDFVFTELAKRLDISFMETRFLLPSEVREGLEHGLSQAVKERATARTQHCVYYAEKDLDVVVEGEACKEYEATIQEKALEQVREFGGQVACLGKVVGKVKIVNVPADMQKVEEGDVLVSIATNPDILPAMKKAAAFVTEQGGITSHAAIVAREMQKPCIIGTKIATKVLKDGDMVEVDAGKGIVRIL